MPWSFVRRSAQPGEKHQQYYDYKPLSTTNGIRLLKVNKAINTNTVAEPLHGPSRDSIDESENHNSTTSYALIHSTLATAPPYDTLSYVWGITIRDQFLLLEDGVLLRITTTLRDALPQITTFCETGYIWIDQICINQEDLTERSQQVSLMGDIYSSCSSVLVWLGVMKELSSELEAICVTANLFDPFNPTDSDVLTLANGVQNVSQFSKVRKVFVEGLCLILSAPWWRRAWVFQEIVLPRRSRIILNQKTTLSLSALRWILRYYWRLIYEGVWAYPLGIFEGGENLRTTYKLWADRFLPNGRAPTTIEEVLPNIVFIKTTAYDKGLHALLEMHNEWLERHQNPGQPPPAFAEVLSKVTSRAKTSNELDQLYAYFGLIKDPSIELKPDYKLQLRMALIATAQSIVRGTARLDIFETLPRQNVHVLPLRITLTPMQRLRERHLMGNYLDQSGRSHKEALPSWVPDYRRNQLVGPFKPSTFNNQRGETMHLMYTWAGSCDDTFLKAHGRIIDTIGRRLTDDGPEHANDITDESFRRVLKASIKFWKSSKSQATKNSFPTMERLLQAMLAEGHTTLPDFDPNQIAVISSNITNPKINDGHRDLALEGLKKRMMSTIKSTMKGRNLYGTESLHFALGSRLRRGDVVCILHGCSNPVALRLTQAGNFLVKGTCFLEGWMDPWSKGKVDWTEDESTQFILV